MCSSKAWDIAKGYYLFPIKVLTGPVVKRMILDDELGLQQREMKSVLGGS